MTDIIERRNPTGLMTPPNNKFAHVVIAPATRRLAFISGQASVNDAGEVIGSDVNTQTTQTFRNIARILDDLGASPADIVQLTIYVVDFQAPHLAEVDAGGEEVFGDAWPVTATTLIGVQSLSFPPLLVEISVIIAVPDEQR